MKKSRLSNLFLFFISLVTNVAVAMISVKSDAILVTMEGDKRIGHTSTTSQDAEGVWYYFLRGLE